MVKMGKSAPFVHRRFQRFCVWMAKVRQISENNTQF